MNVRSIRLTAALALVLAVGLIPAAGASVGAPSSAPPPGEWQQLEPKGMPPPNAWSATAYDPRSERVLMFGGNTGSGGSDGTWSFDGKKWIELDLEVSPSYRETMSMVYDAARREFVLFGGTCDCPDPRKADTWVFDGRRWTERTPAVSPPALSGYGMAYDPQREEVVLFGGSLGYSDVSNQTWVWDGTTWERKHPVTSPPGRTGLGMAYSRQQQGVVLFGGLSYAPDYFDDTWTWDGENWTEQPAENAPSARSGAGMTSYGRQVVLFGGSDRVGLSDGTWVFGRDGWRELTGKPAPSLRYGPAMAYDSDQREVVLYGGGDRETPSPRDTWVLPRH